MHATGVRPPRASAAVFWVALIVATGGLGAQKAPAVKRNLDVPYAPAPPGVDAGLLSLDIYAPRGVAERPVIVMIHGGGWRRGDKAARAMTRDKPAWFVGAGYVYVSVNYRLSPAVKHPTHVKDVARALAWLHDRVRQYGGDPERISVMGHSAGAHLAALVATDHRRLEGVGKSLRIVKRVILLDSAAYDIPRYVYELGAGPVMRRMYETAFGASEAAWRDASPRTHVAAGKGIPPFLIFHTGRRLAGERLSRELAAALVKAGTPAAAVHAADKDHGTINRDIGRSGDWVTRRIMRFLEAGKPGDTGAPTAPRAVPTVRFRESYRAGTRDAAKRWMGGTETMRLASFAGKLFAAIGYWTDVPGDDPRPGGQVLVKRGPEARWEVDRDFPGSLRVSALEPVTFRLDHRGRALAAPVSLLLADASPLRHRRGGPLAVWVRGVQDGAWTSVRVTQSASRAYTRAFGFHRDAKTGVDRVFAGTGAGEIYSGAHDPKASGGIRWDPEPELRNPDFNETPFRRVSAFTVANGKLYASVAPCLYEREDGPEPGWREVYRWRPNPGAGAGLRGITAVPGPDGRGEVILGAREQTGRILRVDPARGFDATVELESKRFLTETLGGRVLAGRLTAYNRFVPGKHPVTGSPIHWVTVAAVRPRDISAAWLLIRHADARYEVVRVHDPARRGRPLLVSTRTLEIAPWSDREIYTGGYDGAARGRRNHNTAWIYRGTWPAPAKRAGGTDGSSADR